jgi:hypothetical protein
LIVNSNQQGDASVAQHRIVCTDQEPIYQPTTHAHIVAVGIGSDPNRAEQRLTLQQVLDAIDRGEVFYTRGVHSGNARLARANFVGEHESSPRQTLGHPRKRSPLAFVKMLLLMWLRCLFCDQFPNRGSHARPREAHRKPQARAAPSSTSQYLTRCFSVR